MTEPVAGDALLREIAQTADLPNSLALWFLGQSSFVVRGAGMTLYFDPYLTDASTPKLQALGLRRAFSPPLVPGAIRGADAIFISHEHSDHYDPATLAPMLRHNPGVHVVAPPVLRPSLRELGFPPDQIIDALTDRPVSLGAARVVPVPAAHEEFDFTPERGHRWVGYVVSLNGVAFYHAGDTIPYDDLPDRLRRLGAKVLLLPINGRDWGRHRAGLLRGNMTDREAADLAAAAGADLLIPMHYDLFPWNGESPGHFADYMQAQHPTLPYVIMARGRRFRYTAE